MAGCAIIRVLLQDGYEVTVDFGLKGYGMGEGPHARGDYRIGVQMLTIIAAPDKLVPTIPAAITAKPTPKVKGPEIAPITIVGIKRPNPRPAGRDNRPNPPLMADLSLLVNSRIVSPLMKVYESWRNIL
jgi:hypothetical protein